MNVFLFKNYQPYISLFSFCNATKQAINRMGKIIRVIAVRGLKKEESLISMSVSLPSAIDFGFFLWASPWLVSYSCHSARIKTRKLAYHKRITYKLATLTFKAKYCRTPLYPHQQLRDHQVARALRSTTAPLFYRPFVFTVFASRAFYYSAPQVWNCLGTSTRSPNTFSSFRRCLKSELFAAVHMTRRLTITRPQRFWFAWRLGAIQIWVV